MTFTKERLIARINQVTAINKFRISRDPDADGLAMDNELLAIALASLEAEPVGEFYEDGPLNWYQISDGDRVPTHRRIPLYRHAPPAPVSVPDEIKKLKDGRGFKYVKDGVHYSVNYANGWNQCRAAMLQGAEPVSQRYKLPEVIDENLVEGLRLLQCMLDDYRERNYGHAHEWIRHIDRKFAEHSESHEDDAYSIFSSLLQGAAPVTTANKLREGVAAIRNSGIAIDAEKIQAERDALNSPVIPDGWIPVSERMPDKLIPVMVMYADGEMWSAMWSGQFWDDGCTIPDPHAITHWREMPAAPKQEVKSGR